MHRENNKTIFAAWISLISNLVLMSIKLVVGFFFHSQVLVADGVNNASDVIASGAALSSMRISKRPADEDHPYGHGKAEVLGAGIVALILGLAAIFMAYQAITAFFEEPGEASIFALAAALLSMVWKQALYLYTIKIGRQSNSKALIATAYDHLADTYASAAAVAGIGLTLIGEIYHIKYLAYGDPAAGLIVSVLVLKLAFEMGQEAIDVLREKAVNGERLEDFERLVKSIHHVKRIDRLRAREHGHYILVDVRVSIPGMLSIQEGHDISRQIKNAIMEKHDDVDEVLIHLNPWYEENRRNATP